MLDLLRTWWPVLLLVYVPSLIRTVTHVVAARAQRRIDESHPDDLSLTAGEWLAREIERRGLGGRVRTVVTDDDVRSSTDAYHSQHGVIQLSAETHYKRDPMHWAIAAHELGHARYYILWPRLGRATIAIRYLKHALVTVAPALVLGNVAFALPHVTDAALVMFALAVALHGFVLGCELIASMFAMDMLRDRPGFRPSHVRSARRMLAVGFSTYLVALLSRMLLLTQWPLVVALTREPVVPPVAELTVLGTVLAAALSLVLAISILARAIDGRVRLPRLAVRLAVFARLFAKPALVGLLLLVWNTSAAPSHAWLVMLALIPVQVYFVGVLRLPMALLDVFVLERLAKRWAVEVTHWTPEFHRDYTAGLEARKAGNRAYTELHIRGERAPPLALRLLGALHLCSLPLLIALWFA